MHPARLREICAVCKRTGEVSEHKRGDKRWAWRPYPDVQHLDALVPLAALCAKSDGSTGA
jgi:hypothetical protein